MAGKTIIINDRQEEVKVFLSTSGAQGERGPQGLQGEQGETGLQGAQGLQGEQGLQGIQGEQGLQGEQGIQGEIGLTGAQGIQGIQGIQGVQGEQGNTGTGVTFKGEVADESSLPASGNTQGDAYLVQSDDSLHIFDGTSFIDGGSIQGPQGIQGLQGIQGIQGETGETGPQGLQGETGPQGIQGIQGPQGEQGIQGEAGISGDYDDLINKPTGTDNFLIKWDGTEGLQDSIIYDNGTSVTMGSLLKFTSSGALSSIEALGELNINSDSNNNGAEPITFQVQGSEKMRVHSTGNVGIGTTSPSHSLHVADTGNAEIVAERASGAKVIMQSQASRGRIGTDSNHEFRISTNSTDRMSIDSSGNVGIGTTTPAEKLEVVGNVKADEGLFDGVTNGNIPAESSKVDRYGILSNRGTMYVTNQSATGSISFGNNGAHGVTNLMRIASDGDVGIGTIVPDEKLHVDGNVKATSFIKDGSTSDDVLLGDGSTTSLDDLVSNDTTGEPTGSDSVNKIVSLTQAEYDSGTPVSDTFYLITDA